MSTTVRLIGFVIIMVVTFVVALLLGRLIGPVDGDGAAGAAAPLARIEAVS